MFGRLFGSKPTPAKPASKPAAPAKPQPPVKLKTANIAKRFTIISECGSGSMSRVYKALDNASGRVVCLKVQDTVKTVAAIGRASQAGRPSEGEIGSKVHHRNVCQTFDFGRTTKGEHFITMEFIEGASLAYVRESRSRDLAGKIGLLIQAGRGLEAFHNAGFIHRDIGPKNILVSTENVAKLIDFGLAVPNTPIFQRPGNRTGTLNYMAPELLRRETTDERLDIFSFGAMAFELLTDRLPYELKGDQMTILRLRMNLDPLDIAEVDPSLPAELCDVIRRMLTKRKEDRISSMTKVIQALESLEMATAD